MELERIEAKARKEPWCDDIDIAILRRIGDETFVGSPLTMIKLEPGSYIGEPTIRLSNTAAQQLMDELWYCGLRPSEGTGSAGALAATQKHLEDMRNLVFKNG